MNKTCRRHWCNCAIETDSEILSIDKMEDSIVPIKPDILKIRELISNFELCHHKSNNWIYNIITAIGTGTTQKGLGTRSSNQQHPVEKIWKDTYAALSKWCTGINANSLYINTKPASQFLSCLGNHSALKEWQVQRVIDKIHSFINWPQTFMQYTWLLLDADNYKINYRKQCPKSINLIKISG